MGVLTPKGPGLAYALTLNYVDVLASLYDMCHGRPAYGEGLRAGVDPLFGASVDHGGRRVHHQGGDDTAGRAGDHRALPLPTRAFVSYQERASDVSSPRSKAAMTLSAPAASTAA
ncbi:hypothetical protein ACFYWU_26470 [Streptomyces chrestomyceticus]|uniref:hypothetical protein n=1 Tax=Streptomyces chrestomyceticus TaxID=68185 RepID=UPI0036BA6376